MSASLDIEFLMSLNQGLQEEQRLVKQMKAEAQRIDEDFDYKYHKLLDSMIKMSILTKSVKERKEKPLDTKIHIKKADELQIGNIGVIETALRLMKSDPRILMDFLESCDPEKLINFINELPCFYFDYSEIQDYSNFLKIFFTRKYQKGGFIDYQKQQDFKSLFNSLLWESDCISFAQGILDELIKDIKSLKKVDEFEPSDGSKHARSQIGTSSAANESTLNASALFASGAPAKPARHPGSPEPKPISIQGIKITSGNENGEAMKSYREAVERYIKDYLIHQPSSRAIFANDMLFKQIKAVFQGMVSSYMVEPAKREESRLSVEHQEVVEDMHKIDQEKWPFSYFELTRLLKKWSKKISVDLAAHVPPKMACMIGTFWSIYGKDSSFREVTFKQLTDLIFAVWFKHMINIVMINNGYIYQLSEQDRTYVLYFLHVLHQRMLNKEAEFEKVYGEDSNPINKPSSYKFMEACYDSLGRYVTSMKPKANREYSVQVSYYFQCISVANLIPLIDHFLKLSEDFFEDKALAESVYKRKRELQMVIGRVKDYSNEEYVRSTYQPNFIFIVFSKKNALRAFDRISKRDLEFAEKFFKENRHYTHTSIAGHSMKYYFDKKKELEESMGAWDFKLMGLLREYLRSIDLNYIDASKSYFKDMFTLKDLLKRDKINKKFTKISHVKMDVEIGQSYSAELAADYIMHKMDELNEDIILQIDDQRLRLNSGLEDEFEDPALRFTMAPVARAEEKQPEVESRAPGSDQEQLELQEEAIRQKRNSRIQEMESELSRISESLDCKLIKYICLISWENRIRLRYYHQLTTILAKSRAQFESRYISPFEITMKFGLEALEKVVAYNFVQNALNGLRSLGIRVEVVDEQIQVTIKEEPEDLTESMLLASQDMFPNRSSLNRRESINLNVTSVSAQPQSKVQQINSYEDICNYMKTSKDIVDYTTLGIDKRNFKDALHRMLKHLKRQVILQYDRSGLASNSVCLTDKFTGLVEQSVFNLVSSRIFLDVVPKNPTMKDFCFFMRCRALSFMQLNDLIQKEDKDGSIQYMSQYLGEVIAKLKSIDEGGSVYLIIKCIEQSIIAIADLFYIVLGFKTPAGSEDILPIFLYCLIKANLSRAQSIFYFLDLMMIKDDRRGKDGFNFTQVETGINFVEVMSGDSIVYPEDRFSLQVMRSEIRVGIHRYRKRIITAKQTIKFGLQDGYSFF